MMGDVSLLKTGSYEQVEVREAVARHFELLKVSIASDVHVVVKPNLIMRCGPERAATLHPAVLDAVLAQMRDMGVRDIVVAESSGGPFTPALLKSLFEKTGIAKAAEKYGVPCVVDTGSHILGRPQNKVCREFDIIAPVTQGIFLVNLCKVKTHCMMMFSGGVKNLFGCVPGLLKPQLHYRFPEEALFASMLLDLAETLQPALTIADGVIGMEGDGPTGGRPKKLGITAAARYDGLYSLDLLLTRMIGLPPERVPTVVESQARGLCPEPRILGDSALAGQVTPFLPPAGKTLDFAANAGVFGPLVRRMKPYLAPRPVVRAADCVGCGKCAETCPAHIIRIQGGKARINPGSCIRCFCCHEMCPERAIDIREAWFFRVFSH